MCEIQASLGIAQPTVSNHLKLLENAGLVRAKKNGQWVDYSLSDGSGNRYAAALLGNLKHWLRDEPEVLRITESLPDFRRQDVCGK